MSGVICLQGGAEFGPDCRDMDLELLRHADGGPVVVLPLAADVGRDYDTAGRNAARWYHSLGASEVVVAEDPRRGGEDPRDLVREASFVVLPGGSPSRLLDALREHGLDLAVAEAHSRGAVVMGASAGAMVLAGRTVLPDRGGLLVDALGLVPGVVVLPHFEARQGQRLQQLWAGLDEDEVALGIPEQSGLLVDKRRIVSLGRAAPTFLGGRPFALAPGSQGLLGWEMGWEFD
jgi:cyanophycinase-like exopeptidase